MKTQIAEYSPTAAALADLNTRYSGVVFDVGTTKGMTDAKKARAEIKGYRTALEAKRKEIKAPALERCRQIDEEAKHITAELLKLETPIDDTIKAEEDRKEAEKKAKEEAERQRVEGLRARVAALALAPRTAIFNSQQLFGEIERIEGVKIDSSFGEFIGEATATQNDTLHHLRTMRAAKLEAEAEAERLRMEREEVARLQAEQRKREVEEAERIAKAEREAQERIEEANRKARAEREEADRKAALEREKADREARQAREAAQREAAAKERKAREEQEAIEAAERKRIQESQEAEERARLELLGARDLLAAFVAKYGHINEFLSVVIAIEIYFENHGE